MTGALAALLTGLVYGFMLWLLGLLPNMPGYVQHGIALFVALLVYGAPSLLFPGV